MSEKIADAKLLDHALKSFDEDQHSYITRVLLRLRFSLDILTIGSQSGGAVTLVELMMMQDDDDELSMSSSEDEAKDDKQLVSERVETRTSKKINRVPDNKVEEWAVLIHGCLCNSSRHDSGTIENMFTKSKMADPHQMIALLFADLVDFLFDPIDCDNNDGTSESRDSVRTNPYVGRLVEDVYRVDENGHVILLQQEEQSSCSLASELVMSIFGYDDTPSKKRFPRKPFSAFLSAMVAARCLYKYISLTDLAKVVTCIYCTIIPYREEDNEEITDVVFSNIEKEKKLKAQKSFRISCLCPGEILYRTLLAVDDEYGLQMTDSEMIDVVQRGIALLNRNIKLYAVDDFGEYFDFLWTALAMVTPSIRVRKLQTPSDFHEGLTNMKYILESFNAYQWLESFRGVPNVMEMSAIAERISLNAEYGVIYIKARLLAFAILTAFATLTGGNAPLSYFVGDSPTEKHRTNQLGDTLIIPDLESISEVSVDDDDDKDTFEEHKQDGDSEFQNSFEFNGAEKPLPTKTTTKTTAHSKCNTIVYNILRGGRKASLRFDTCKSPLAAFGYGMLGDEGLEKVEPFITYPMTPEKAKSLLFTLPSEVSIPICKEIRGITIGPRSKEINEIHDDLVNHAKKISV